MADESWGNGNGGTLFTNVRILDGTGEYPYTGEVLVQGNRIKRITKGGSSFGGASSAGGATVIDGMGATLMPGLIDAHLHLSWNNAPGIDPINMMEVEEHMLVTMEMAKLVIDAGFTSGLLRRNRVWMWCANGLSMKGGFRGLGTLQPGQRLRRWVVWVMRPHPTFHIRG
jgi:hypothetical protein